MSVKILANMQFEKSHMNLHMFNEVPSNPEIGRFYVINGVPSFYTTDGGEPFWLPLGLKRSFYKHAQTDASTLWTVEHNLATYDLIIMAYDLANNVLYPAQYNFITPDKVELQFNVPVTGKVIVAGESNKLAGFNIPASLNQETVSYGSSTPDDNVDSTLYFQVSE